MAITCKPSATTTITGPGGATGTLPAGWAKCLDIPDGKKAYRRHAEFQGAASSIDTADEAIRTAFDGYVLDLSHSRSPGSALASITLSYTNATGSGGEGEDPPDDNPTAPDTVTLSPTTVSVALSAHPMFAGKSAKLLTIDGYILQNDLASALSTAGDDAALRKYVAMRYAGIDRWNTAGYTLTTVRHFAPGANARNLLAACLGNTCKVFAWANVEGSDAVGEEPKWIDVSDNNTAKSFEWMLVGASPSVSIDSYDITITYQAAWKWCKHLYEGGSWEPALPAVSS